MPQSKGWVPVTLREKLLLISDSGYTSALSYSSGKKTAGGYKRLWTNKTCYLAPVK